MKTARNPSPSPQKKKPRVLFPKGEVKFADVFTVNLGTTSKRKNCVIGRFPLKSVEDDRFQEFRTNIKPYLKRNLGIIPGIRTAFILIQKTGV